MFNCYLTEVIDKYKSIESDEERDVYIAKLIDYIWEYGSCVKECSKTISFDINHDILPEEVCKVFERYKSFPYTTYITDIEFNDYHEWRTYFIKGFNRYYYDLIGQNFGVTSEFIQCLGKPKKLYYECISDRCNVPTAEQVEKTIMSYIDEMDKYQLIMSRRKPIMTYDEYKVFVNKCLHKIFSNYKSFNDLIKENGERDVYDSDNFDEDHYATSYVLQSVRLYLLTELKRVGGSINHKLKKKTVKRYSRDERYAYCETCGSTFIAKSSAARFCPTCRKERNRVRMAKEREQEKIRKARGTRL